METGAIPAPPVARPNFGDADPADFGGNGPEDHAVHGIDVSRFQGPIDWRQARAHGVSFAFIKATEGGDLVDPMFRDHWRGAGRAGVPRGAYHFFYHCRPAAEQAEFFIRNVPQDGTLPPVLDMEWTPFSPTCTIRRAPEVIRAEAKVFLDIVEAHYGRRPIIYSTVDFYQENQMWRVGSYPFWLRSVAAHPDEVYGGRHWSFWQYTSTGLIPGVEGEVDINVFDGSSGDWARWLAAHAG
jgi:lysozyme